MEMQNEFIVDNNDLDYLSQEFIQKDQVKMSDKDAHTNLIKSFIGVGILSLPYSFQNSGFLLSSLMISLISLLVYHTTWIVIDISSSLNNCSVKYVIQKSLGARIMKLYTFFMVFYQLGLCLSYILYFVNFLEVEFQTSNYKFQRLEFAIISFFVLVPISFSNNYASLTKYNFLANLFLLFSILMIIEFCFEKIFEGSQVSAIEINNMSLIVGTALYSFEGIVQIHPIRINMENPHNFLQIFKKCMLLITLIYIFFPLICLIGLGQTIQQVILSGLDKQRPIFYVVQLAFAISLIISYPFQLLPCVQIIQDIQLIKSISNKQSQLSNHIFVKFCTTGFIMIIAVYFPYFSQVLNLLGALSFIAIQFIFPIIAYQSYKKYKKKSIQFCMIVITLLFSIFLGIFASKASLNIVIN